jgi:hypothetical protein
MIDAIIGLLFLSIGMLVLGVIASQARKLLHIKVKPTDKK